MKDDNGGRTHKHCALEDFAYTHPKRVRRSDGNHLGPDQPALRVQIQPNQAFSVELLQMTAVLCNSGGACQFRARFGEPLSYDLDTVCLEDLTRDGVLLLNRLRRTCYSLLGHVFTPRAHLTGRRSSTWRRLRIARIRGHDSVGRLLASSRTKRACPCGIVQASRRSFETVSRID